MHIFTELVYPLKCPNCDIILHKNEKTVGFCRNCAKNIKLATGNICLRCGKLVAGNMEYCDTCQSRNHSFDKGRGIYVYTGNIKKAMYKFKYSNKRYYSRAFANQAIKIHGNWLNNEKFDAIVPVPMYREKEKRRGYNQAETFARSLSEKTGIPIAKDIIRREIVTVPMKELNYASRQSNLQKAFKLSENSVKYNQLLVVDDIYTTGSTMDAVAELLKKAGVKRVCCLSVCIGEMD